MEWPEQMCEMPGLVLSRIFVYYIGLGGKNRNLRVAVHSELTLMAHAAPFLGIDISLYASFFWRRCRQTYSMEVDYSNVP